MTVFQTSSLDIFIWIITLKFLFTENFNLQIYIEIYNVQRYKIQCKVFLMIFKR